MEREFHEKSIKSDFWPKIVFLRNRQKSDFFAQNFFNKGKKNIFGQKSPKICQKSSKYEARECFLTF